MTSRWQPLPDTLPPEVAYLARLLRECKDRTGLSLKDLAGRGTHSKSAWGRYLNGTGLPPRTAVQDLAQLSGEPTERLLALWERAETVWSGRAAAPQITDDAERDTRAEDRPEDRLGRFGRWNVVTIAVLGCAVAATAAVVVHTRDGVATGPAVAATPNYTIGCRGTQCIGSDPEDMGCDADAATYADLHLGAAYLELRISDQCESAWARVSSATVDDQVSVVDQHGHAESITVANHAETTRFLPTRMVAAHQHGDVLACMQRTGERRCTPSGGSRRVSAPAATTLTRQ